MRMKMGPLVNRRRTYYCKVAGRTYDVRPGEPGCWQMRYTPRGCRSTRVAQLPTMEAAKAEAGRQWLVWELGAPAIAACPMLRALGVGRLMAGDADAVEAVLAMADWCQDEGGRALEWLRMVVVRGGNKAVAWPNEGWKNAAARFARPVRKPPPRRQAAAAQAVAADAAEVA